MALVYGRRSNGSLMPVSVDDSGNMSVSLGTKISGEQISLDRLYVAEVYDFGTGNVTGSTSDVTLKNGAGVLGQAQVLTSASGVTASFYDGPSTSGTLLGVLPCDTLGTTIYFRRPFSTSLVVKFSGANSSNAVIAVGRL